MSSQRHILTLPLLGSKIFGSLAPWTPAGVFPFHRTRQQHNSQLNPAGRSLEDDAPITPHPPHPRSHSLHIDVRLRTSHWDLISYQGAKSQEKYERTWLESPLDSVGSALGNNHAATSANRTPQALRAGTPSCRNPVTADTAETRLSLSLSEDETVFEVIEPHETEASKAPTVPVQAPANTTTLT